MTTPNTNPFGNLFDPETFITKVTEALKPVTELIADQFDIPEAKVEYVEYDDPYAGLLKSLKEQEAGIKASSVLSDLEKAHTLSDIYKIWAGLVS